MTNNPTIDGVSRELVECDACPNSGGCVKTCMKAAPAVERQEPVSWKVTGRSGLTLCPLYPEWATDDPELKVTPLYDRAQDDAGVEFGFEDRSAMVSQEAYSIFLARESALQSTSAQLEDKLNKAIDLDFQRRETIARLEGKVQELEQDKARLDALDSNFWDVRFNSSPNGDAGDSSINIEVVGHWMDKPLERVIGENYSENLRAAIDQAMNAPAYPPERPEYPEIEACLDATAALNGERK